MQIADCCGPSFGFMRKYSPFVQKVHSIVAFLKVGGPPKIMRLCIGSMGDHMGLGRLPTPVTMPQQKSWKWNVFSNVSMDGVAAKGFFDVPTNKNKLWKPDEGESTNTKTLLCLIFLPGKLGHDNEYGSILTCHELCKVVSKMAEAHP